MSGVTVVLGWDALDSDLVERFRLTGAFGPHHTVLETLDNPVLHKPHTYEIWPSIVTGVPPSEHGIRVASADGLAWKSPLARSISKQLSGWVSRSTRTTVERILQNRGTKLDFKSAEYYHTHGISTVFDGRRARPIAIPNYRIEADEALDFAFDRGAQLSKFLTIEENEDGTTRHAPRVSLERLEERLVSEAYKKFGVVRVAIRRKYDLVFVWFGLLDSVGHLAPVVDEEDPNWQERTYRLAAEWTTDLRSRLRPEDSLICVSDHGLRDGDHTHSAFIGSTDRQVLNGTTSVLDVREAIERVASTAEIGVDKAETPPFREEGMVTRAHEESPSPPYREADEVKRQLKDLGYL